MINNRRDNNTRLIEYYYQYSRDVLTVTTDLIASLNRNETHLYEFNLSRVTP